MAERMRKRDQPYGRMLRRGNTVDLENVEDFWMYHFVH